MLKADIRLSAHQVGARVMGSCCAVRKRLTARSTERAAYVPVNTRLLIDMTQGERNNHDTQRSEQRRPGRQH
jgi:hypothetical protein